MEYKIKCRIFVQHLNLNIMNELDGKSIVRCFSRYEDCIIVDEDDNEYHITFFELKKMLNKCKFTVEKKRTRTHLKIKEYHHERKNKLDYTSQR